MKIIDGAEFDAHWKKSAAPADEAVDGAVREIIAAVRSGGDRALGEFTARFDGVSVEKPEVPPGQAEEAWKNLEKTGPELAAALELAADHIRRFSEKQRAQFSGFEYEIAPGLIAGQRIIPVERAAVYAPAGRFPLISSVLMGMIPALVAGVGETFLASPPLEDGLPDRRILAAAYLAGRNIPGSAVRIFAMGGAQAVAALALGTETVPRADLIAGPGNKYVAAAKRLLFGEVGIDFVAGPTDVLIIVGASGDQAAGLAAADLLAQAEHDPDARARILVPDRETADRVAEAVERRLAGLPSASAARASLDAGGLIIIYHTREEAIRIANTIAPEHLELQTPDPGAWVPSLKNYGSLFIGIMAAEALGDYSAGINHTLPTSGSARFTGGLSVRHFLKTVTTLRGAASGGYDTALAAAERIALAEGLTAHAQSIAARQGLSFR
jgi:histidinol dehydrogenase